jgi:hypothetical protein
LALVQVLALDSAVSHRSENSLETILHSSPSSAEHTQALLNTAIELHDRQIRRNQRWTVLIPVWVAVISGIFLFAKAIIAN